MRKTKPKVIVASRGTSRVPEFAGSTWVRLQYLLGLEKLGIEAYWFDSVKTVDPFIHHHSLDYIASRFHRLARDFGFGDRYSLIYNEGARQFGMPADEVLSVIRDADLVLNISGHMPPNSPLNAIPRRAYIDVDPGFTQIWGKSLLHLTQHNFFFTVGQNIGTERFRGPTDEFEWITMLPPVVLSEWPARIDAAATRFSTIADWHATQGAVYNNERYLGKQDEIRRFIDVPHKANRQVEIALTIHQTEHEDQGMLLDHGWLIRDPFFYAGDVESYREFIQFSRAEFSVAKEGYVKSNSGWVSDRTACYLASGKPVIVQSTGFESSLPVGMGLLTFTSEEDAVASFAAVDSRYLEHCRSARKIAEDYFDSDRVLGGILDKVGLS